MNRFEVPVDTLSVSRRVMPRSAESGLYFASGLNMIPGVAEEENTHITPQARFDAEIVTKDEYLRLKEASQVAARYSITSAAESVMDERPAADRQFWEGVPLGEPQFIDDPETGLTIFGIGFAEEYRAKALDESKDFYVAQFEEIAALDPNFDPDEFEWDEVEGIIRLAVLDTEGVSEETRERMHELTEHLAPDTVDLYDVFVRKNVVDVPADRFVANG